MIYIFVPINNNSSKNWWVFYCCLPLEWAQSCDLNRPAGQLCSHLFFCTLPVYCIVAWPSALCCLAFWCQGGQERCCILCPGESCTTGMINWSCNAITPLISLSQVSTTSEWDMHAIKRHTGLSQSRWLSSWNLLYVTLGRWEHCSCKQRCFSIC